MNKMSNDRLIKAIVNLIFNIICSFVLLPILIVYGVVFLLDGNFAPSFFGAVFGSVLYRMFDEEFKTDLKMVSRWLLLKYSHDLEHNGKLKAELEFDDWMNQDKPPKELTEKEKLNKSILDD